MSDRELLALYTEHLKSTNEAAVAAISASGCDALVIHAGTPAMYFADDQEISFRINPYFAHFLPVVRAHHLLYIEPEIKPVLVYVQPEDFWHERTPVGEPFWFSEFDVRIVASPEKAWQEIPRGKKIAYVGNNAQEAEANGVSSNCINPAIVLSHLNWKRSFKTPYEIFCIEEANRLAAPGHIAAREAFARGASEIEIHHAYVSTLGVADNDLPYESVVALDEKSAILHYQNKRKQGTGSVFLLDAGAGYLGYASDITRTVVTQTAHPIFQSLRNSLESLQKELCDMAVPGVSFPELHRKAHMEIGRLLQSHGVIKISGEDAAQKGITRAFFPHGLGHFLGITVHDVGGNQKSVEGGVIEAPKEYPHMRMTRTITKGNAFTVEPGIYFIEMLLRPYRSGASGAHFDWKLIDELLPFGGIRIEDNIVATESGNRNITREFLPD